MTRTWNSACAAIAATAACLIPPASGTEPLQAGETGAPYPYPRASAPSQSPAIFSTEDHAVTAASTFDFGHPTDHEQLLLELVNRARANPSAEADRYDIGLNDGLAPGTIGPDPKPPLSFEAHLIESSRGHSQWMLAEDLFQHVGQSGSTPPDRMAAAGYPFSGSWAAGENIGWKGTTGDYALTDYVQQIHRNLVKSPGHRSNLLSPRYEDFGTGVVPGTFTSNGRDWNAVMITENFAASGGTSGPLITGVVYFDMDADGFYSPFEGVGGISISPAPASPTSVSSASGGYAVVAPNPFGTFSVVFSGGGLPVPVTREVTVDGENVKLDLELSALPPSSPFLFLSRPQRLPSGEFEFRVLGHPGSTYQVQYSQHFGQWHTLETGTLGGPDDYWILDTSTGSTEQRYYRVQLVE